MTVITNLSSNHILYRSAIDRIFNVFTDSREQPMKFHHICNCGRHFHCGSEIVHYFCEECAAEYLGPICSVTRELPVDLQSDGRVLCQNCHGIRKDTIPEYGT